MSEKLDVYNYKRIKTGKIIERNENAILDKCDYILAIQCWIINAKCEILLTRRKLDKVHGGMWEPTGGLVQSGENSIQATKRELNEEIGINISERELKFIKEKIDKSDRHNVFRDVYVIKKDININELKFNDGEVIDSKWVSLDEYVGLYNKGEVAPSGDFVIKMLKEKLENVVLPSKIVNNTHKAWLIESLQDIIEKLAPSKPQQ